MICRIASSVIPLVKDKPRTGLTRYSLGIIAVYALIAQPFTLAIIAKPTHARTSMPTNLDGIATFTASIIIGSTTPLIYAYERGWRVGNNWKPLLFTLYASIVVGSLIINAATALALHSIPRLAPACMGSVTIGAYGPVDGLVTAPPLGLLAGYTVTSTITNKQ